MEGPARIGKYELGDYLGGGMSRVYKARDTVIGRTVVVKILTDAACQDEEAKARFLQEARMAGNILHPNIIRIYDFGEDEGGHPYMVMELLQGQDLRSLIKANQLGGIPDRLRLALQVARALEHVHERGIVHRDIKPENIFLDSSGTAKLMDFGIAKTQDLSITRPGFTMGTPFYMAPEQVQGAAVTPLVDVYAFGILLFELLTGQKPFTGESVEVLFFKVLKEPLDPTPLRQAGVPEPVVNLVARCAEKEPAARPQSLAAVASELDHFLQPPAPAPAQPEKPVRRVPKWLLPAVTVVWILTAVGIYYVTRPKPLPPRLATEAGEMVLVPAGPFEAGEDRHKVNLPAFYIDRTEVTNQAYQRFCQARNRPLPPGFAAAQPDYPAVNITLVDAQEFARWAGKRLPTPLEWEKAARGTDGRLYPWGGEADARRANVADNPSPAKALLPAASTPAGASPFGLLNLAGNAWEFVDELKTPSPGALAAYATRLNPPPTATEPWYVIRGGAYNRPLRECVAYEWATVPARFAGPDIGFRCARDAK